MANTSGRAGFAGLPIALALLVLAAAAPAHGAICIDDSDCDDGNVCTLDRCGGDEECNHAPVDAGTTVCGEGVCRVEILTCLDGVPQTCTPGLPVTPDDASCNDSDDDCDGAVDDDFPAGASSCGTGACRRSGTVACVAGHVVDSCQPASPLAATDTTCDRVDDDCDGAVDDDIARTVTTCGVGICAAEGNRSCESGTWVDTCTPGPPVQPADTNCNNIDSDCDGQIDEDYVATPSFCGAGACARTGLLSCVGGHEVDSCLPGQPAAEICNGVDDDCNGAIDDDGRALCDDGDTCNGSETCGGAAGCVAGERVRADVAISIPRDLTGVPGGTILVPVQAQPADGIEIDVSLEFDPAALQAIAVTTTEITRGAVLTAELSYPGEAAIRVATADPMTTFRGAGPILMIEFRVLQSGGSSAGVRIVRAIVNEAALDTCVSHGRVTACAEVPGEVVSLSVSGHGPTSIAWSDLPLATSYDVVTGSLASLRVDRSVIAAACLAAGAVAPAAVDSRALPAGEGSYYLVRARQGCGVGSFGGGSASQARAPIAACP